MKLFRKLYLQVILGMAVLAAGLLTFSAVEVKRQGLSESRHYGEEQAEGNARLLREKLAEEKISVLEENIRDIVVSSSFWEQFGSMGVLWKEGEEVRNLTPYDLDLRLLEDLRKEAGIPETEVFTGGPFRVGERRLLTCYRAEAGFGVEGYSFAVVQDVTMIYRRAGKLILYGTGAAFALLLLVGFLLYRIIYRMLRPLEELKCGAADLAAGKYGSRILVRGKDEIGDVTESFNRMAGEVERHVEALREANEKQKQLLGSLAHEMKTPLTAMIGNADLLLTVRLEEKQKEQSLTYILEEARRLARLSEKMLELTGLYENGGAGAVWKRVELDWLFGKLAASAAFRLKEKDMVLEIKPPEEGLSAVMDEDLMESLLLNLVDNACKASSRGARILVSADRRGVYVEDFGRGIPEAELKRVTEAFYMVDKARGRSSGGSGLGLALCLQIAKLHGWELLIESREGEGTEPDGTYVFDIYGAIEQAKREYEAAPEEALPEEVRPRYGLEVGIGMGEKEVQDDSFSGIVETSDGKLYQYELFSYGPVPMRVQVKRLADIEHVSLEQPEWGAYEDAKSSGLPCPSEEELQAGIGITLEEARGMADAKVSALGLADMDLVSWDYAIRTKAGSRGPDGFLLGEENCGGYLLHYARRLSGIPITYTIEEGGAYEDLEGETETWSYERLDFYVTKEGIDRLDFTNQYDLGEIRTEYVKLLPITEVMKIYEKMMQIQNADVLNYEDSRTYRIDRISFGYTRIYEPSTDSRQGMLVPAWDFFGSFEVPGRETYQASDHSFLTINASDGSIINRSLGY